MVVGPANSFVLLIISYVTRRIRLSLLSMKEVRAANSAERAKRTTKILMITCRQNAAAPLSETSDAFTVRSAQSISRIYSKQPELIKISSV
jgi:hypothetical protein